MRAYEIMASKSVLTCPFKPDFDQNGELEGEVYLKFDTIEQLQDIISELKQSPRKRNRIARNARNYCVEHHSWDNRLELLLDCLN